MDDRACRNCHMLISHGDTCPVCGGKEFTDRWNGYVVMFNAEKSSLAKILGIKVNSAYAISVD